MRKSFSLLAFVILAATTMYGQATRTWVSGVGDDANPCSRTAPCKTWAGAISKTAQGGEIDALDPGGFGALTITKSITLDGGGGQVASTLVTGTNGIVVQAGGSDVVTIRNIRINGLLNSGNAGINGIRFLAGRALIIQNCNIFGFSNNGIDIATNGGTVVVEGTSSHNNGAAGLAVTSTATTHVSIDGSHFDLNTLYGVKAADFSAVTISNSTGNGNVSVGFLAQPAAGTAVMNIFNSVAANNTVGIQAGNSAGTSTVNVSGTAVHDNSFAGFVNAMNGTVKSFGNNYNTTGGAPTLPNLPVQ